MPDFLRSMEKNSKHVINETHGCERYVIKGDVGVLRSACFSLEDNVEVLVRFHQDDFLQPVLHLVPTSD